MRREATLSLLLLLLGCTSAEDEGRPGSTALGEAPPAEVAAAGERPNIILVVTDDQDVPSVADMPSVQRHLVEPGITFRRAYTPTPICCPARISILRGQYAHNHGLLTAGGERGAFRGFMALGRDSSTLATWLDAAGYNTFFAGKYLNGYGWLDGALTTYVPPGWDQWFGDLAPQGYFDYTINENGVLVDYGSEPQDYLTDVLAGKAIEFIRSAADAADPFFMYIAPFAPHDEPPPAALRLPRPAPRHAGAFGSRVAPKGPSFNEPDLGDKPRWMRTWPVFSDRQLAEIDRHHRLRLESLLAVDEMVERIFTELAATGEMGHTYVFYTTDNGFHLGQHRMASGKGFAYEEDIIVPLVVSGPGLSRATRDELVLLSDLAPTITDLAGIEAPGFVDGRSLRSLLEGDLDPADAWRQAFLIEYWLPRGDEPDGLVWRGIRTQTHKYVEWADDASDTELYDLEADPYEIESRHEVADPALVGQLDAWLEALAGCAGEPCRALEQVPPAFAESPPAAASAQGR